MSLAINIAGVKFENPIWAASGTFGTGEEFLDFVDLDKIGAVVTKTVTLEARVGNPAPRIVETASGMLNSIGLENKGIDHCVKETIPFLRKYRTKIVVSIAGNGLSDYTECARRLSGKNAPDMIEINLSCPNVTHKGAKHALFAQDGALTGEIVRAVKRETDIPSITKLTPNVTDITEIAIAAEKAGTDALALVNTYFGMAIDSGTGKPVLGRVTGGLSGPAIKPMALKAVYDVYKKVKVPIIGIGGIMTAECAVEFMLAGARAIQVGTANFVDPRSTMKILQGVEAHLGEKGIKDINELTGKAHG
ncbi:MAG: dihydroorotate dehydrogenase [Candidatus Omnitrophica bacterium]|nr:dihydroorotate dehydrogenase [Candidatus Omnitrophota bacterium]